MKEKKVKWLWSYNVDKTECWLSEMAKKGWHLSSVNRWTRIFTLEKGEQKHVTYHIQYDSKNHSLPTTLQKEGWNIAVSVGNWLFLTNEVPTIRLYPSRDKLVKRNRTHAYTLSVLATFQISFSMLPIIILGILASVMEEESILAGNVWFILLLVTEIIVIASFSIYVFRAYRRFEKREMDAVIDSISSGNKLRKFKGGWMYQLEETKAWLERIAKEGYELEKVTAAVFTFRKTNPSNLKYECMFEYKVQPSYFATHKELGWKLKYSSNMTLLNYSIWAMPYEDDEEMPQFSYDKQEQRQAIKRAFKMNIGMSIYLIAILLFSFYTNTLQQVEPFIYWSFGGVMRVLLLVFLLFWSYKFIQILFSYRKSLKALD
ncbi:DUF2812 domain-containing protein [Psychrobacillus sp.]|uniref:DUF2812 domain-containing protein n=1 Tax=Psychrobacillus sp. TaxID=1871623 RepID=UPI0028BD6BB3|nr:DUF2812 domain-containing protein [Psychrobacillus sp.]